MTKPLRPMLLALSLTLAACASVGPDYHQPKPADAQLHGTDPARETQAAFEAAWWKQFNDPVLDALIQRAMQGSLDLHIAMARVNESRSLLGTAKSNQLPTIDTDVNYSRALEQEPGFTNYRVPIDTYQAGFDASWELDLFGGIRRSVQAARADLGASEGQLRDAQVTLFAEVARNYFALRGTQQRIQIAHKNIDNQADALKLIQARSVIGTASEQDVASAAAQLSAVKAQLPTFEASEQAYRNRLAVLLGERPGALDIDVSPATFTPIATALPIGDADQALARRPDVSIAERQYAAATARIGVAKADYYPHISLGGFVGFLAGQSNNFGGPASRAFSIGPSISWSGLNVERVRSSVHASEARADEAETNYRRTILGALEDMDNAVTAYNAQRSRVQELNVQVAQSERAAHLAKLRYEAGATGYLELLEAERVQLSAEDAYAEGQSDIDTRAVALYKALGGGWQACVNVQCGEAAKVAVK